MSLIIEASLKLANEANHLATKAETLANLIDATPETVVVIIQLRSAEENLRHAQRNFMEAIKRLDPRAHIGGKDVQQD